MNYTDIENTTIDKGTEYEETIINWRTRRGKVQLRCPLCDRFFAIPKDITIDASGYFSASLYHFCEDIFDGEENNDGWTVLAHLIGWTE